MSSEAKKRNEGGGPGSQVLADCETFFAPKNWPGYSAFAEYDDLRWSGVLRYVFAKLTPAAPHPRR
jgi:hypothetical protein